MKKIFFLAMILMAFSSFSFSQTEAECWGFCIVTSSGTEYVSSCIKIPCGDAVAGFPNTKVVRAWRLKLKEELGDDYKNYFELSFVDRECTIGNVRYQSSLDANEGRDCYINKRKGYGVTVKKVAFVY